MPLPASFLEDLRARTPMAALVSRKVKLARAGRLHKGCCPFHGEKTPSFYVYDDHFHCFGCGAHGDAIGFVMQSQGSGFMEAVEQLASEAGLDVPTDPERAAVSRRQHDVVSALTAAQAVYQQWLYQPQGKAALDYLHRRGLTDETIMSWGIGWSGGGRGALAAELARDGISVAMLVETGLMRGGEGAQPFDLFFDRVMFPIRDRRGRVVSFGGRVLGDGQPKYLNGPETDLFAKRRTLYGLDVAREAVHRGAPLVVVEGYLDVISMHQAGHAGAVAPLGSALTDEHLDELWRHSPAPVLCFDGDVAGLRAAARAVDNALHRLASDRTLGVARLAEGEDPDSLIRVRGADAMGAVLAAAEPLVVALYDLLRLDASDRTPEDRAAFRARLVAAAEAIADHDRPLASEYRRALLDRYYAEFRPRHQVGGSVVHLPAPRPRDEAGPHYQARVVLAILVRCPDLIESVGDLLADTALPGPLAALWQASRDWATNEAWPTPERLADHLAAIGIDAVAALGGSLPLPSCCGEAADFDVARRGLWDAIGLLSGLDRIEAEVQQADSDFAAVWDERTQNRLLALIEVRNRMIAGETDAA